MIARHWRGYAREDRASASEIVTRWQSMDAIRRFAGADVEAADVPTEVEAMMIDYDRRVVHYEVLDP